MPAIDIWHSINARAWGTCRELPRMWAAFAKIGICKKSLAWCASAHATIYLHACTCLQCALAHSEDRMGIGTPALASLCLHYLWWQPPFCFEGCPAAKNTLVQLSRARLGLAAWLFWWLFQLLGGLCEKGLGALGGLRQGGCRALFFPPPPLTSFWHLSNPISQ